MQKRKSKSRSFGFRTTLDGATSHVEHGVHGRPWCMDTARFSVYLSPLTCVMCVMVHGHGAGLAFTSRMCHVRHGRIYHHEFTCYAQLARPHASRRAQPLSHATATRLAAHTYAHTHTHRLTPGTKRTARATCENVAPLTCTSRVCRIARDSGSCLACNRGDGGVPRSRSH